MNVRRVAAALAVIAGAVVSIGSPAPTGEQQAPLWVAYAYAAVDGGLTVPAGQIVTYSLHVALTLPSGGSGGWTESLDVIPGVDAGEVNVVLADDAGAVLAEGDFSTIDPAANRAPELEIKDFLADCEPGVACGADLTLTLTGGAADTTMYLNVEFVARDNELSADPLTTQIPVTLTLTPA